MNTKLEQINAQIDAFTWDESDVPEQLNKRLQEIPIKVGKVRRMDKRIAYFAAASILFLLSFNMLAWTEKERQEKSTVLSSHYFDYLNQH